MMHNGRVTTLLTGKDKDEGGGEGVVDYSADPITAFLGKFLPKGEDGADKSPKAEDLVGSSSRVPAAVVSQSRAV